MDFMIPVELKKMAGLIRYPDRLLLIGSCFTEHIGNALAAVKFPVLQNPNGILFDPASVCRSLLSYIENIPAAEEELFQINGVWSSWQHHSRFSHINAVEALKTINEERKQAHLFLKKADWLIITLGSSFSYRLKEPVINSKTDRYQNGVANCHRAPAQWFDKYLLETSETISMLEDCYRQLMDFNPGLRLILTVSPVRHIRDGVVENNRSKARLIEAVHHLAGKFDNLYYFPAYELVIDVLRDYRFYDADLVHPNYMATEFVMEKFSETCIDETSQKLMQDLKKIRIARNHKPFQPETRAHRDFLASHFEKVKALKKKYPFLDLDDELVYFSQA